MGKRKHSASTVPGDAGNIDGPPAKKQSQRRSLFVRSLAATVDTETLINHFSQSFPIKHATAVVDPKTKHCKGYGFITFADAEDAERALKEFHNSTLLGKKIKVEIAEPRHREIDDTLPPEIAGTKVEQHKAAAAAAKEKREAERRAEYKAPKLIVRNLPWSIKKPEQLAKLFMSFGKIKHVTIPNKKPGLMAGFGFVVMRGRNNAERALEKVNGKEIDGRTLAVDWAVDKEVWEKANDDGAKVEGDEDEEGDVADVENVVASDEEVNGDAMDPEAEDASADSDAALSDEEDILELSDEEDDIANASEPPHEQDYTTTLFIRNLPFTTTDESLHAHFTQHFGPVRYARTVLDPMTERPRGTAFVSLFNSEDALKCLREAPTSSRTKPGAPSTSTVLQSELDDPSGRYTLSGRTLILTRAVDRTEASRLATTAKASREDKDKRRLYLLSEGTVSAKSPLYDLLSQTEVGMREASAKQRKKLIQSNPALHLSLTRLSIRNIPRSVGSKELKALARSAVVGFATDVKEGRRERLNKEEVLRGGEAMVVAEKDRKRKGKGIVKQAKVVFESRDGGKVSEEVAAVGAGPGVSTAGRSRGYGFVEYYTHRAALMGLRWLNGHAVGYEVAEGSFKGKENKEKREDKKMIPDRERQKRLIAEFAIENAGVVKRRSDREVKARDKNDAAEDASKSGANREALLDQDSLFNVAAVAGGKKVQSGYGSAKRGGAKSQKGAARSDGLKRMIKQASVKKVDKPASKLAQRQRIINKKRAARREKGKAATG